MLIKEKTCITPPPYLHYLKKLVSKSSQIFDPLLFIAPIYYGVESIMNGLERNHFSTPLLRNGGGGAVFHTPTPIIPLPL